METNPPQIEEEKVEKEEIKEKEELKKEEKEEENNKQQEIKRDELKKEEDKKEEKKEEKDNQQETKKEEVKNEEDKKEIKKEEEEEEDDINEEEKPDDTVFLDIKINESYATTEVTEYFKNKTNNPIEISIDIPLNPEIILNKFIAKIGKKKYISKILAKEKAIEKYNDTIAEGNTGIITKYNEKSNSYQISIGNLLPNKTLEFKSYFIQFLTSNDMSFCYTIMNDFPNILNNKTKIIKANIEINTLSKITRLITSYLNSNEIYSREFNDNFTKCNIKYENNNNNSKYNIPFSILFRTENSYEINLYSQYNKNKNETSYILSYLYSKNNSFKLNYNSNLPDERQNILYTELKHKSEINTNPGLFIFLIDQSGSMGGNPIKLVCESLLIFLQSLPKNSYYQLIGFGTDFEKYNEKPVFYSRDNINETFNIIKKIDANKGGTNISKPLKNIFEDCINDYKDIHLSRNIFLLTDGEVSNSKECFELISKHNNLFRIHALGIGNSFDKQLIETSGRLGKGSYNFVKDINQINNVVIQTLNKCMINYSIEPNFKCENKVKFECQPINDIVYDDEIIIFSFISEGNNNEDIEINFKIKDNESEMEENLYFNKEKIHKLNEILISVIHLLPSDDETYSIYLLSFPYSVQSVIDITHTL